MRNVFTIFKSDLRRLSRSFWAMVIIAACMLLPAMYAWVNIYANWDPYGNTGGVKIAVVSNDIDYKTDDGTVENVGEDVIKSLRAKTSIGWQFLDSDTEALDGVYDGTYYAAIIIDKNFTYNMYNFLTTDMTQPTIRYYVNSKTNAIATKITDTAASTIKASVNENYLKIIIETIFKKVNGIYANIEADDPVSAIEDILNNVNNNLKDYNKTLGAFTKAGNMLTGDLNSMNKTIDYAIYTIGESRDHLAGQVESVNSAKGELSTVNDEIDSSLRNISGLLQTAISQFSGKDIGTGTTINATLEQLEKQYRELLSYLETRGGETNPQTADVLSALNNSIAQMEELRKSLGLNSNFSSDDQAYLNMLDKTDAMKQVQSDFNDTVVPGVYREYVGEDADTTLQSGTVDAAKLRSMSYFMLSDVSSKLNSIDENIEKGSSASDPAVADAAAAAAANDASDAAGELQALASTYGTISDEVGGFDDASLASAASTAIDQLNNIAGGLKPPSGVTLPTVDIKTMLEANKLAVDTVRSTLTQDVYPALDGALDSVSSTLGDMSSVLMNTSDVLKGSKSVLSSVSGTVQTMNTAFAQMQNVLGNVSDQITDVLSKIDGLKNDEKVQTLLDFFGMDPDAIGSFLAQPVETVTETVYPVANYGSGMTPFYSTLAIWVGSVILGAILKAEADATVVPDPKMWQLYLGRYLTFFFFGQLQAIVIVLGDMFILGCQCLHPWLFLLAGSVTAFSFSILIYSLTVSFGDVGKAIVVVVMILQIAGSSGSFPIELLPEFFQKMYIFFPFPYAINAMRECIAGLYRLDYLKYLSDLMMFVAGSAFIGLVIRRPFVGLTAYIEDKMEDTELLK